MEANKQAEITFHQLFLHLGKGIWVRECWSLPPLYPYMAVRANMGHRLELMIEKG